MTLPATPYDFELTASHGHTYPQPPTQLVPVHQEDVEAAPSWFSKEEEAS